MNVDIAVDNRSGLMASGIGMAQRATGSVACQRRTWAQNWAGIRTRLIASDLLAAFLTAGISAYLTLPVSIAAAAAALILTLAFAAASGSMRRLVISRGATTWRAMVRGGVLAIATMGVTNVFIPGAFAPAHLLIVVPLVVVLSVAGRFALRHSLRERRREGHSLSPTLIVTAQGASEETVLNILRHPEDGYYVVGQVTAAGQPCGPAANLGALEGGSAQSLQQMVALVREHAVETVMINGALEPARLREITWALEPTGARVVLTPGITEFDDSRVEILPRGDSWNGEIVVRTRPTSKIVKGLADRAAALAMLLVAGPIIAVFAAIIRATSPGKAFYQQTRVGRDGVNFQMLKLRSMYIDADARRAALLEENDCDGLMFKQRNDPRITPIGRFIRRFSVDELPQLWNVVRGEMSLVGPRPALPEEVAQYEPHVRRRLLVTPGLTGLWQVSGRSDLAWEQAVKLDLRYVDNRSAAMDMKILARTAKAVFGGSGAY